MTTFGEQYRNGRRTIKRKEAQLIQSVEQHDLPAVQKQMEAMAPSERSAIFLAMLNTESEAFLLQFADTPYPIGWFGRINPEEDDYTGYVYGVLGNVFEAFYRQGNIEESRQVMVRRVLFRMYQTTWTDLQKQGETGTARSLSIDFLKFIQASSRFRFTASLLVDLLDFQPNFTRWEKVWQLFLAQKWYTFWPYHRLTQEVRKYMPYTIEAEHRQHYGDTHSSLVDGLGNNLASYVLAFV